MEKGKIMMMVNRKKVMAVALAGMLSFGFMSSALTSVTEAAPQEPAFTDGTHNEYSHRLKEEERTHKQNVRYLRYQLKHDQLSQKDFDKKMRAEQNRHDRAVKEIKADYEKHKYHHH